MSLKHGVQREPTCSAAGLTDDGTLARREASQHTGLVGIRTPQDMTRKIGAEKLEIRLPDLRCERARASVRVWAVSAPPHHDRTCVQAAVYCWRMDLLLATRNTHNGCLDSDSMLDYHASRPAAERVSLSASCSSVRAPLEESDGQKWKLGA